MGATKAAGARKEGGKPTFDVEFRPSFRVWAGDNFSSIWNRLESPVSERALCELLKKMRSIYYA